jgi:cell division protein FtsI/penicillin-binding protein 2
VRTRIFGTLEERFVLTITGAASSPAVAWDAPATFPGLLPGERLRRVDSAPARGRLLARDGSPLGDLVSASNVIGTVGEASGALLEQTVAAGFPASTPVGLDGLEAVFQRQLGGRPGGSLYAGARLLASAAARPGRDVRTSISPPLQSLAVTELGTSLGGIVVMEPDTGEVLAAAGAPLSELQPPGSTFKIITLTAVLEAHLGTPASVYRYATSTTLDGFVLHNANGEDCGGTLANAFAVSCNSVFAPLGVRLGAGDLLHAAEAYGFNAPSPIGIAAESSLPPVSLTDALQLGESAIGQAQVEASPLQMARVAATIALVGRRPVPTFALVGRLPLFPRVIPVSVARTVRALMHDVVSFGTGIAAQIPGVVVAGKTGTAEVVTPPPCTATGASGTTGTGGATRAATGGPAARPASGGAALAHAAQAGTGGVAAPPAGTGPTGAASSSGGGAGAPSGQGATAGAGTGGASSGSADGGGTAPASGSGSGTGAAGGAPAGSTAPAALTGPTGPTNCAGVDNNPYDTDAWFVAFAPEINPRFVVAVLLPHDGAGGTTAAPLAKVILEQALASGS